MSDYVSAFGLVLMLFVPVIFTSGYVAGIYVSGEHWEKMAIESDVGRYNSKTGEFEFIFPELPKPERNPHAPHHNN